MHPPKNSTRGTDTNLGVTASCLQQNIRGIRDRSAIEESSDIRPFSTQLITFVVSLLVGTTCSVSLSKPLCHHNLRRSRTLEVSPEYYKYIQSSLLPPLLLEYAAHPMWQLPYSQLTLQDEVGTGYERCCKNPYLDA